MKTELIPGNRVRPRWEQRGTALFAVVPIAILMMTLMVAFVGTSVETSRANVADVDMFRARAAAQNAASLAIADVWSDFESASGGQMQLWNLRNHLDDNNLSNQGNASNPARTAYMQSIGLAENNDGRFEIDGVEIERLDVYRIDDWDSTDIIIEVDAVTRRGQDGSSRERRNSIQEVFTIAPPTWDGLDYALLANNINCLLCHTTIDNAERVYNTNPALAGTFDSVKIGSIESIHFREDPDSKVAGVMLIGADALLGDGHAVTDWSAFNLEGAAPSAGGTVSRITEDAYGNAMFGGLDIFDPNAPSTSANMFLDFFDSEIKGGYILPTSFPSPFPDNGGLDPVTGDPITENAGNRIIDDSEFVATVQGSAGVFSGGNITVVPHGQKVNNGSKFAKLKNGADPNISGIVDGNVFMHGTKNNPIVLDGDVAIDGDVIISGYVKGSGALKTRGNVYVAGDILYADGGVGGNRTFGMASDGTENNLAIAAGGNIVMGDFYHRAWGKGKPANGGNSGSFNFTMDELAIFNRVEWMKTQVTLPGKPEYIQTGEKVTNYPEKKKEYYWVNETKYKWVKNGEKYKKWFYKTTQVSNGLPAPYTKYTTKRVKDRWEWRDKYVKVENGTRNVKKSRWVETGKTLTRTDPIMEWVTPQHPNPGFVADHTARFYNFKAGQQIPIFNKKGHFDPDTEHWVSDERAGRDDGKWDYSKLTRLNPKNKSEPLLFDSNKDPIAVVSSISPTNDWINTKYMAEALKHAMNGNPGGDKTFEVNATLYSANAIIGVTPSNDSPHTNGKMIVNGGLVGADVGLLAPEGTQVNYDGRGSRALSISSESGLEVTRRLSAPRVRH